MARVSPVVVAFALACVLLAGCTSKDTSQIKGLTNVPTDAPSAVGDGDFPYILKVVSESAKGEPIKGAAVLAFHIEKPYQPPSAQELKGRNATFAARTDANGEVHFGLLEKRTYSFLATAPGYTSESRLLRKMMPELREKPEALVLYKSEITKTITGKLDLKFLGYKTPVVTNCCYGAPFYYPQNVSLHEDPGVQAAYVYRVSSADVKLKWTNSPTDWGDLGLRVMVGKDAFWDSDRAAETVADATPTESLLVSWVELAYGSRDKEARLSVGPYTRDKIVATNGLDFKIDAVFTFSGDAPPSARRCLGSCPTYNPIPGFEAALLVGALLVGLFLVGRSRNG